jgi:L-amino acid N-acyltransferase YncA
MMAGHSQVVAEHQTLVIRRATPADAEVCGRICFDAFTTLANKHKFQPDFPAPEIPVHVLSTMFSHSSFFCVVAEQDGKIIGSNCLDERTPIAGVGPITIDPAAQNHSAGRQMMQAVMTRAAERKFAGVRLVQAAYHNRSLSLYAKLGFVVREPLACMQGTPIQKTPLGYRVRPAEPSDLVTCNDLCVLVHGHDRGANSMTQFSKAQPWSPNRRGESEPTHRPLPFSVMPLAKPIGICKH